MPLESNSGLYELASFDWGPMLRIDFLSSVYVLKLIFDLFYYLFQHQEREERIHAGSWEEFVDCI